MRGSRVPIVVPAVSHCFKQRIETINQQLAQLDGELLEVAKVEQESGEKPAEEGQRTDRIEQQGKATSALEVEYCGHWTAHDELVATLAAARFHPVITPSYERLRAAGKPLKVARGACARKLLHMASAVVTHEQAFDPDSQSRQKVKAVLV